MPDEAKDYSKLCDYCLADPWIGYHCGDVPRKFRGCHETFNTFPQYEEHRAATGGCHNPQEMEDYYRLEGVWHKREPKPEDTQEVSPNSRRTPAVGKRTTSNASKGPRSPAARQPGQS